MSALVVALAAGIGVAVLWFDASTSARLPSRAEKTGPPGRLRRWMRRAGMTDVEPRQFAAAVAALFTVGAVVGYIAFGGVVGTIVVGAAASAYPLSRYRARAAERRRTTGDAWPRLIEEIRVQVTSGGSSIPQGLLAAGARAPAPLRPAFEAAGREWLLTTDFSRALTVLKAELADPDADTLCETLLVAHEVGATDIDRRLHDLATDRFDDVQGRKDARSRQAAARFARSFVIVVPVGMAAAGSSIGGGRAAYGTPLGQAVVAAATLVIVGCWIAAGRIMRLPEPRRVFDR